MRRADDSPREVEQLGYGVESVRAWVRQADIDDGVKAGVTSDEQARMREPEQEVRELKRANEILKRVKTTKPDPKMPRHPDLATLGWVHWHNTKRLHGCLEFDRCGDLAVQRSIIAPSVDLS